MNAGPGRKAIALLTAKEIFDLVRDDLVLVEEELARQSAGAFEPVSEITSYLLGGGGKRLRPALLLLCNAYTGRRGEGAIRLAAVVELLHSATLIHDDVIDSANTRRGRPSANSRWGNHRSVLAGDWLYMHPDMPSAVKGMVSLRGVLVPVVDLAEYVGHAAGVAARHHDRHRIQRPHPGLPGRGRRYHPAPRLGADAGAAGNADGQPGRPGDGGHRTCRTAAW